ncbi:unnamed protein product, partial [marine sediment metagenome]
MANKKSAKKTFSSGSTLILAVVLTSLLAIIGVMFVMVARVNRVATSAISDNKELKFAVESIIAKISQELVLDVPCIAGQEYYDYPDANNAWLASLEPDVNDNGTPDVSDDIYYWRQISDVTGFLIDKFANNLGWDVNQVATRIVKDREEIPLQALDPN